MAAGVADFAGVVAVGVMGFVGVVAPCVAGFVGVVAAGVACLQFLHRAASRSMIEHSKVQVHVAHCGRGR